MSRVAVYALIVIALAGGLLIASVLMTAPTSVDLTVYRLSVAVATETTASPEMATPPADGPSAKSDSPSHAAPSGHEAPMFLDAWPAQSKALVQGSQAAAIWEALNSPQNFEPRLSEMRPFDFGLTMTRGGQTVHVLLSLTDGRVLWIEDDPQFPEVRTLSAPAAKALRQQLTAIASSPDSPTADASPSQ